MIELYKCGTKVKLVGCDITGIIVDILIKKEAIQYGVAYYNAGGDHLNVLMIEEQFEVHEGSEKMPIGFKN